MHDLKKAMASAAGGMTAQSLRLRLSAENIANTDTPGYRRKLTSFETAMDHATGSETVRTGRVRLSSLPAREEYAPDHPLANESGMVAYSNVDPLIELADAREAQRSYDASVSVFDQARQMHGSMLDLIRR